MVAAPTILKKSRHLCTRFNAGHPLPCRLAGGTVIKESDPETGVPHKRKQAKTAGACAPFADELTAGIIFFTFYFEIQSTFSYFELQSTFKVNNMNNKATITMNDNTIAGKITSWLFGLAVLAAGVINACWGEDIGFGIFLILLSFVYFLPVNAIFKKLTGHSIPGIRLLKILLGIFIIWAAFGVGELFEKIELMKQDL
jgi:hypothetical protein